MKIRPLAVLLLLASTLLPAQQFEIYHQFANDAGLPARMTVASDGNIYGTDTSGEFGHGEIFRLIPDGNGGYTFERLYSFHGPDGDSPLGLIQASNGRFYGTTSLGGAFGGGAVYGFDPATGLVVFHSFPLDPDWVNWAPWPLVEASDGNFYGVTLQAGAHGWGILYRLTPSGEFTTLHDFSGPEGERPGGSLIQASDGYLYGTATLGGAGAAPEGPSGLGGSGGGTLFRSDLAGNVAAIHSFTTSEGRYVNGDLVEAPDGFLYGTAFNGGATDTGSVYRADKAGNVTLLHSFPSSPGEGQFPNAGLLRTPDGNFYGVNALVPQGGTVYRITSGGEVTTVATFLGDLAPYHTLALYNDGTLFGACLPYNPPTIAFVFRIPLPGTGYEQIHDFASNGPENPTAELVQTADGTLWGTTSGGGSLGLGTIFRLSGGPLVAHDFSGSDGAAPGSLLAAPDGNLYGVTASQGSGGSGTVFRLAADETFTTLHAFSGPDGSDPEGGLMFASDGNFYGTTYAGGDFAGGTLFRLEPSGALNTLLHFNDPFASKGRLFQGSDGDLYGTTYYGGAFGRGTAFRSDRSGVLMTLHSLIGADGEYPQAGLVQASDGNFYGTTSAAGPDSRGTIFRVDGTGTFTLIHSFTSGGMPLAPLVQASDGLLYGTTAYEAGVSFGSVFRIDPSGANFETVHEFQSVDGAAPTSGLFQASDGMLYGTASSGGWSSDGVVYRIDLAGSPPSVTSISPTSGRSLGGVSVTVTGDHFRPGATASLDAALVLEARRIFGLSLPAKPGSLVDVTVTNTDGQSATLPAAYFADFLDAPSGTLFHDQIEMIFRDGITAGCGGGSYCPDAATSRAQIAVFLLKAEHGAGYKPPACTGVFADVVCPSLFADWIEQFFAEDITAGCGGNNYCPQGTVPRDHGAVLVLKAEHGPDYVPPPCQGVFADVPCPGPYAAWVEQLAAEGITSGCGNGNFCPTSPTSRGQMATFLTKILAMP